MSPLFTFSNVKTLLALLSSASRNSAWVVSSGLPGSNELPRIAGDVSLSETWLLAVLGTVAAILIAFQWLVLRLRGPNDSWIIAQVRGLLWLHARLFFRLQVRGLDGGTPLPATGPFILVANHQSGADPALLSLICQRRVRFLMAREYYETSGLRWLFRSVQAIAVNRDGKDLSATKEALRALHAGQGIGVFPQGGIREAGTLDNAKAGVALLAMKTAAPVVPFYIDGTPNRESVFGAFLIPSRVTISCGRPFCVVESPQRRPQRWQIEQATEQVLQSIAELRPQNQATT